MKRRTFLTGAVGGAIASAAGCAHPAPGYIKQDLVINEESVVAVVTVRNNSTRDKILAVPVVFYSNGKRVGPKDPDTYPVVALQPSETKTVKVTWYPCVDPSSITRFEVALRSADTSDVNRTVTIRCRE